MRTAQSDQERRSIKVKDFLEDFRNGISNDDLMEKYHLTPTGLDRFYSLLVERGVMDESELSGFDETEEFQEPQDHADSAPQPSTVGSLICPSCYHAQPAPFEVCPSCGVVVDDVEEGPDRFETSIPMEESTEEDNGEDTLVARWSEEHQDQPNSGAHAKTAPGKPIEIPLDEDDPVDSILAEEEKEADPFEMAEFPVSTEHDDDIDEIVPGVPFEYDEGMDAQEAREPALCGECDRPLFQTVRNVYTKSRGILGLAFSGVFLLLGLLGAWGVTVFQGYSVLRLIVIYFTGISLLVGSVFLAIGIFMLFLARQKVLYCDSCGRVYPCM